MRLRSAKYRNYASKKKEIKQNLNAIQFEEPTPTPQNAAYKMIVNNVNEWYKVMNIRYEHLQEVYDVVWSDTSDKEGKTLLETQVKLSQMMTETNKNRKNKTHPTTFEIIPSKNQTLYIIILYHTTNTVLIQGNQKSTWANKEFPILKAVLLHKREHNAPMDEAYNKTLEMPGSGTKLPEQQSSKTHHNNKNNQTDTPPQITEKEPNKAYSMRKPPIPKIIITPPNNTGRTQEENNSESNEKGEIWVELEDMSPQKKKSTDKSYDVTPKTKKTTATKKAKNGNGEVTIQMYSNLKKAINNIDEDLNRCTLRYEKMKEVITSEVTEYIKNLINPIAEENKKLKEELKTANIQIQEENNQLKENLAAAYSKIEELKSLILDSTTQCKNAVKETKK